MAIKATTVRFPPHVIKEGKETAQKLETTFSELLVVALVEYCAKYSEKELQAKHKKVTK